LLRKFIHKAHYTDHITSMYVGAFDISIDYLQIFVILLYLVINPYAINGPYMSLKGTLSTDQWTIYGLLRIQTRALTSNLQFST